MVLIWNSRVVGSSIHDKNQEIITKYCPNFTGYSGGSEEEPSQFDQFFKDGMYEHRSFVNDQIVDLERFIGGNLSASYAPKETDKDYLIYKKELTELFETYSNNGVLLLPMITRSYVGEV